MDGLHNLIELIQLFGHIPLLGAGGVDLRVKPRHGYVGQVAVHRQNLVGLIGQETAKAHARVHLNMSLHYSRAALRYAV